jgi:hypothetical protein
MVIPARSILKVKVKCGTDEVGLIEKRELKPGVFIGACMVQPRVSEDSGF